MTNDKKQQILISLKFQLLNFTKKDFMEAYPSADDFKDLLYGILYVMNEELPFFALDDDILDKIDDVNNELRFLYPDVESRDLGNTLLHNIASIRHLEQSRKSELLVQYIKNQLNVRRYRPTKNFTLTIDQFLDLLSFDYVVYDGLINQQYDYFFQEGNFLSSTNSFLTLWPELYQHNPEFLLATQDIIQDSLHAPNHNSDRRQYKKLAHDTLHQIKQYKRS